MTAAVEPEVLPEFADEALAVILDLGQSAEAMVDGLRALGVKGIPGEADDCLWVHYLRDVKKLPVSAVYPGGVENGDDGEPVQIIGWVEFDLHPTATGQHTPTDLPLPPAADWLAQQFDLGAYPELVAA